MTRRFGAWETRGIISPGLEKDFRTETISGRQGAGGRRQEAVKPAAETSPQTKERTERCEDKKRRS